MSNQNRKADTPHKTKFHLSPKKSSIMGIAKLIKELQLTVPRNYIHNHQLERFRKNPMFLKYFDPRITDENFSKVSTKLIPGKSYRVCLFRLRTKTSHLKCMSFLKENNLFFTGAQGLSLIFEYNISFFPKYSKTFSFDLEGCSLEDDVDGEMIPEITSYPNGEFLPHLTFGLNPFDRRIANFTFFIGFGEFS